jgi:light-dependent protochlorophyllide reductase
MSLKEIEQQQRPLHILITGSSQGIGLAAAQSLIRQGHHVYHACRTKERAEHAVREAGGGVALEACDLSDLDTVKRFAKDVEQKVPRMDVLCLNAGVAPSSSAKMPKLTAQGFESCIGVNHLGHFLLAQLLYQKLAADGGGRLIVTASAVHDPGLQAGQSGGKTATLGDLSGLGIDLNKSPNGPTMVDGALEYHGGKVYKDSKLANILMARQAAKTFPTSITSVCFNPGLIPSTGLFSSLREESPWKAQALTFFASIIGFSIPLEVAGERLVYLATVPQLPNGSYFCAPVGSKATVPEAEGGFAVTPVSKEASNDDLADRFWKKSLEVVHAWL